VAGGTEDIVTSPDQHKPGPKRAAYAGALITVVILLLMLLGNHQGKVEDIWLVGSATTIVAWLLFDWALRKNGIKRG
jgi:hypothetical protein